MDCKISAGTNRSLFQFANWLANPSANLPAALGTHLQITATFKRRPVITSIACGLPKSIPPPFPKGLKINFLNQSAHCRVSWKTGTEFPSPNSSITPGPKSKRGNSVFKISVIFLHFSDEVVKEWHKHPALTLGLTLGYCNRYKHLPVAKRLNVDRMTMGMLENGHTSHFFQCCFHFEQSLNEWYLSQGLPGIALDYENYNPTHLPK